MDHVESVACSQPPQKPNNVGAYAISDKRIAVVWDKPPGNGYKFKVTAEAPGKPTKTETGEQGFGNAGFSKIMDLVANTNYTVNVELECKGYPGTLSPKATTHVKTLVIGKL